MRITPLLIFPILIFGLLTAQLVQAQGNTQITSFSDSKRVLTQIHQEDPYTLYCGCRFQDKKVDLKSCGYQPKKSGSVRANRLEWEHVVPAENFGRSFAEWREGVPECQRKGKKFKGRKCAERNPVFRKMESDLYNIWPEIGELNALRSHYSMAELGAERTPASQFGQCRVKIADRKFEPSPNAKGRVARVYLYMDQEYPGHGIVSDKSRKLFQAWDQKHPVDEWECKRARKIASIQGNINRILAERCQ